MKSKHTILAFDPGLRDFGFAVLAGRRFADGGVVPLRLIPKGQRLGEVRRQVRALLRRHHPQEIVVEKTYRHPLPWLHDLYRQSKIIGRQARRRGVSFTTYAPQTVRKGIVGNGWATKQEVAFALSTRYPALRVFLTQDRKWKERYWQNMFDALALALHHHSRK